jgi:hypothetical protein
VDNNNNNNSSDNLLISALHDALAVLGDYAKEELLLILKRQYRIALSENGRCSTKDEIEKALIEALGTGGQVLVNLWNEKIEVAGGASALSSVDGSRIRR